MRHAKTANHAAGERYNATSPISILFYEIMTPLENITADKAEAETQVASSQGLVICNLRNSYL
jgi:hypothetical protein